MTEGQYVKETCL